MADEPIAKFQFAEIQILRKNLAEKPIAFDGDFNFDIKVEIRVHGESKHVIPFVYVNIRDGDKTQPLAEFLIICLFNVENFDTAIIGDEEDKKIWHVPKLMQDIIKPMSISTVRGVIY